jgi:hypothetical protein
LKNQQSPRFLGILHETGGGSMKGPGAAKRQGNSGAPAAVQPRL